MYYNNLLSLPILFVLSLIFEPRTLTSLPLTFPPSTRTSQILALLFSGLVSLLLSYTSAWCLRITSPATYSLAGTMNKVPLAAVALLFFEKELNWGSMTAVVVGGVGLIVIAWGRRRDGFREKVGDREKGLQGVDQEEDGSRGERVVLPLRKGSVRSERGRSRV